MIAEPKNGNLPPIHCDPKVSGGGTRVNGGIGLSQQTAALFAPAWGCYDPVA